LKEAFTKATGKQSNLRYLKIRIVSEKLELGGTGNCGTTSLDFNSFQKTLSNEEACYIAFRYKDAYSDSPWAFIMYTPDNLSVRDRTVYASSFGAARDALGSKFFSKIKRYSLPSEFSWIHFQNSESERLESSKSGGMKSPTPNTAKPTPNIAKPTPNTAKPLTPSSTPQTTANIEKPLTPASPPQATPTTLSNSVDEKPWSQRELLLQQLEREEEIARREYEQKAVAVIGLAKVAFSMTDPVTEAINQLQEGAHNWIQIKLNHPPTQFELVECKNLSEYELESSVDPKNPQFYLYNSDSTLIVIYCCPEQVKGEGNFAQARQNRMVYATAKSSLIEALSNLNLSITLKKYDITEPKEILDLSSHLQSTAADIKSAKQLQGSYGYNDHTGYRPPGGRPITGSPVFGNQSLASVMVNNNSRKPLPKGVVIPPKGAHC
jgi:hypothetical protein